MRRIYSRRPLILFCLYLLSACDSGARININSFTVSDPIMTYWLPESGVVEIRHDVNVCTENQLTLTKVLDIKENVFLCEEENKHRSWVINQHQRWVLPENQVVVGANDGFIVTWDMTVYTIDGRLHRDFSAKQVYGANAVYEPKSDELFYTTGDSLYKLNSSGQSYLVTSLKSSYLKDERFESIMIGGNKTIVAITSCCSRGLRDYEILTVDTTLKKETNKITLVDNCQCTNFSIELGVQGKPNRFFYINRTLQTGNIVSFDR